MNKYLEKAAEILSEENQAVAKTFAVQTAAGIPAHLLGGAVGGALGAKYLKGTAKAVNRGVGHTAHTASMAGKYGRIASKYIRKAKGTSGAALGVGLGMSAIGGLADLAALKHGFHQKGKKK